MGIRTTIYLHSQDGAIVGTTTIDTDAGYPALLAADDGRMFVREGEGLAAEYVAVLPVAVIVTPCAPTEGEAS